MTTRHVRKAIRIALGAGLLLLGAGHLRGGAVAAHAPAAETPPPDEPSWKWPESRWRAVVGKVRAGRSLLPSSWPGGSPGRRRPLVRLRQRDPGAPRQPDLAGRAVPRRVRRARGAAPGARASRALPRPRELLRSRGECPAPSASRSSGSWPPGTRWACTAGSTSATRSWGRRTSASSWSRAMAALSEITGRRPVGVRTPSWDFSPEHRPAREGARAPLRLEPHGGRQPLRDPGRRPAHRHRRAPGGVDPGRLSLLRDGSLLDPPAPLRRPATCWRSGRRSSTGPTRRAGSSS